MATWMLLQTLYTWLGVGELLGGHGGQGRRLLRDIVVEAISTFTMMMCVCLVAASHSHVSVHHAAMASGLVVTTVIWVAGSTSGGVINPAITISAVVVGTMRPLRAACYIIAQCAGSYAAVTLTLSILPEVPANLSTFGMSTLCQGLKQWQGVVIEALLTFILAMSVYATVDTGRPDLKGSGPLAVGLSVAATNLFGIPFTGASTNPARSFGPALASGNWINHWVYWVGPIIGAITGGLLYEYCIRSTSEQRVLADIEDMDGFSDDANVMERISEYPEPLSEVNSISGTMEEHRKSVALPAITIRRESIFSNKKDSIVSAIRKQSFMSTRCSENSNRKMSLPRAQILTINQAMVTLPTPHINIRKMSLPVDDPNIVIANGGVSFT